MSKRAEVSVVFTIDLDSEDNVEAGWSAEEQMTYYSDLLADGDLDSLVVFRNGLTSCGSVKYKESDDE